MPRNASDKRDRLTAAAIELAYAQGFDRSTIADIAAAAGVPSGSVYYHFRSKDDVASAIAGALADAVVAESAGWDAAGGPRERLAAYIDAQVGAEGGRGSRVGAIALELRRQAGEAAEAGAAHRALVAWAAAQYEELGFSAEAAEARAMHLITGMEGAALMAAVLEDSTPIEREAAHLKRWVAATKV
ncbi:TetR/AcrR family transcriptional regulator [Demequina sp.]|uniref:TetR/AcrR family transcriptional regulator n=1 Tax=Demequina sp. TaxID=2050685 RepID=UPI0025D33D20|nr:TetR/AcrR family transcriptional regulator [Demequina sp.]